MFKNIFYILYIKINILYFIYLKKKLLKNKDASKSNI